jgi:hypothetical protein
MTMKALLSLVSLVFGWLIFSWNVAAAQEGADAFVGVWNMIGIERHEPNGQVVPLRRPYSIGQIIYTTGGHYSSQMSRPDRPVFATDEPSADEALIAFKDYGARYGTFTVDEAAGTIAHHQQNSLAPSNDARPDLSYSYEFSGNRMMWITAPRVINEPGHRFDGVEIFQTYIWERAE